TDHVFGIDLHPVAVTLARVTYLLAIGTDRIRERAGPLAVPVYLGDSIQLNESTSILSPAGVTVTTTDQLEFFASELRLPESVVADAARFDHLINELAERAATRLASGDPPAIGQVMTNHGVTDEEDRKMVEDTYRVLAQLHDQNRDHIWAYYVRNLVRPLE